MTSLHSPTMPESFPPVSHSQIHTLILGSMPGKDSLKVNQYYAHRRNAFWPIMAELYGAHQTLSYATRLGILLENNIGLWDVIGSCRRKTSLDSAIEEESIIVNDFHTFIQQYRSLRRIFFNGGKAEQSFKRYVAKQLPPNEILTKRLPSTSPANARMSFAEKLLIWRVKLQKAPGEYPSRLDSSFALPKYR